MTKPLLILAPDWRQMDELFSVSTKAALLPTLTQSGGGTAQFRPTCGKRPDPMPRSGSRQHLRSMPPPAHRHPSCERLSKCQAPFPTRSTTPPVSQQASRFPALRRVFVNRSPRWGLQWDWPERVVWLLNTRHFAAAQKIGCQTILKRISPYSMHGSASLDLARSRRSSPGFLRHSNGL